MELTKLNHRTQGLELLSAKISLVIAFADKNYQQTNPEYYKILLDNNKKIISEKIMIYSPSIELMLKQIYEKYMNISYDWPLKYLADVRKVNDEIEIVYGIKMGYINGCIKDGQLVNIREYQNLNIESYYDGIISSTATRPI